MEALRVTIFPTKSCIGKITQITTSLNTGNTPPISIKSNKNISQRLSSQIMHIAPVKQSYLIDSTPITNVYQLKTLVKEIKEMMASKSRDYEGQVDELIMVDAIQRLGLEYYFQDEIYRMLGKHYERFFTMAESSDNLHDVALSFRLLRQAGYNVPADIFNKFKDKDGDFKKDLRDDTSGLMNLFEASQLSIPGEQILDDAAKLCEKFLKTTAKHVGVQAEAKIIEKTLSNPYYKSLPRLSAAELDNFETSLKILHGHRSMTDWIYEIQELSKIDFIKAHDTYKNEITRVSRWWKELCLAENLKLARSQPVKWHMWSLVVLPGPEMAELRIELTKSISFIYIIDDIFDVYGTLEELTLFTEAVNRWDYTNIQGLPDYMKMCLSALYDTTNEISNKLYVKHEWNPKHNLQNAWAELCNAFLVEAKWFACERLPTTEEYLKNGIVSSGVYVVSANVLSLLSNSVGHRSADLCNSKPDIVTSAARILRLWDDLGTSKDENQDGNDGSFIACYMNQFDDSSAESAREFVVQMISDSWKSLNQECLSNSSYSAYFKAAFLNLARMVPIMYSYDENHKLPRLDKYMKPLLRE